MRIHKSFILTGILFFLSGIGYSQACSEPGSITRVKNNSSGTFEYVIFDIKKGEGVSAPEFQVKSASPPFTDYSGEETYTIQGRKFKTIVFRSINWMCEIHGNYSLPKAAVKDIKLLSSFEGIVEFVVGYRLRSRYVTTYSYDAGSVTKVVMKFKR